jgi:hypothetical protein
MIKKLKNALAWRGLPLSIISDRYGNPGYQFVSKDFDSFDDYGFDKDHCIFMHDKFTWANISAMIGLFPSVSMAKNAGWNEQIEDGYSEAFFSRSDGTPLFVYVFKEAQ